MQTFLDIGCGRLSSLAAHRLGAAVTSFDYDPHSVATTEMLKAKFAPKSTTWKTMTGSALDGVYAGPGNVRYCLLVGCPAPHRRHDDGT